MEEAKKKGQHFDFTHFILISKLHEPMKEASGNKKSKETDILWVNAEEEAIAEVIQIIANLTDFVSHAKILDVIIARRDCL